MNPEAVEKGLQGLGERIVIGGIPRAGKTTLADTVAKFLTEAQRAKAVDPAAFKPIEPLCTDSFIGKLSWSDASEAATVWFDAPGPWIVEGVAAIRALRKWLRMHETGKPCDTLVWNEVARVPLNHGQVVMAKGCQTILREIFMQLDGRGVKVIRNGPRT